MTYSPTPTNPPRSTRKFKPRSFKNNMQSLLAKGKAFLTPSQSSTNLHREGIQTAESATQLFPVVDPAIDGDECLHDCDSCTVSLPRKWEIDNDDALFGHVKGWDTHVIVATGKTDWVRDIADEKGSLMEKIEKRGLDVQNGTIRLSASDMPTGNDYDEDSSGQTTYSSDGKTRCLVLPKWTMVEGVGNNEVDWLMDEVIGKGATNLSPMRFETTDLEKVDLQPRSQPQIGISKPEPKEEQAPPPSLSTLTISPHSPSTPTSTPKGITLHPCPHSAIILMCSHKTRDWRCGASAPLLRRELERHLRPLGLYRDIHDERPGGVGIYFINHVGGHKYSANVMVYRRARSKAEVKAESELMDAAVVGENGDGEGVDEGRKGEAEGEAIQGIWLARVRPEDCENIVRYTVLQGKVVKPLHQLRGGFNRERGLVSW